MTTPITGAPDEWPHIFGIGLSRTGTTSLTLAFEALGIPSIHYPHDSVTMHELASRKFHLTLLKEFRAVTDISVAPFYRELSVAYPESLFVLTIRQQHDWIESVEKHEHLLTRERASGLREPEFEVFTDFIYEHTYGAQKFDRDLWLDALRRHNDEVIEFFAEQPHRLLVMNICEGEGWTHLLPFLGLVTNTNLGQFPHSNDAADRGTWKPARAETADRKRRRWQIRKNS